MLPDAVRLSLVCFGSQFNRFISKSHVFVVFRGSHPLRQRPTRPIAPLSPYVTEEEKKVRVDEQHKKGWTFMTTRQGLRLRLL